jgi:hypothetical protein
MDLREAIDDLLETVGLIPGEVYTDPVVALQAIKRRHEEIVANLTGIREEKIGGEVRITVDISDEEAPKHISELTAFQTFVIVGANLIDDDHHNRIKHDAQIMIDADKRNFEFLRLVPFMGEETTFWGDPDDDLKVIAVLPDGKLL